MLLTPIQPESRIFRKLQTRNSINLIERPQTIRQGQIVLLPGVLSRYGSGRATGTAMCLNEVILVHRDRAHIGDGDRKFLAPSAMRAPEPVLQIVDQHVARQTMMPLQIAWR